MANAKKCDRCGSFYEKNIVKTKGNSTLGGMAFICLQGNIRYILDNDLCDECLNKLMRFLDGAELKAEDDI